jgi:hypothetical protein
VSIYVKRQSTSTYLLPHCITLTTAVHFSKRTKLVRFCAAEDLSTTTRPVHNTLHTATTRAVAQESVTGATIARAHSTRNDRNNDDAQRECVYSSSNTHRALPKQHPRWRCDSSRKQKTDRGLRQGRAAFHILSCQK